MIFCERLSNILAWGFLDLVWGTTMMLGIAGAMLVMDAKLALVVLAILPFLGWVSARFQRRILSSARRVRATNSRITASFNEAIMGVLTSKAFVREQANLDEFRELTTTMHAASVLNLSQAAIYVPIVITLASLATGLALAIGGMDLLGGVIAIGTLVAFIEYAEKFFRPVQELSQRYTTMQAAMASAERLFKLLDTEPAVAEPAEPRQLMARPRGEIAFEGVTFGYNPEEPVLHDVSFKVRPGERVGVVGWTEIGRAHV